jgi:hypothetical protein
VGALSGHLGAPVIPDRGVRIYRSSGMAVDPRRFYCERNGRIMQRWVASGPALDLSGLFDGGERFAWGVLPKWRRGDEPHRG